MRQTEIEERGDKTEDPAVLIPAGDKDGGYLHPEQHNQTAPPPFERYSQDGKPFQLMADYSEHVRTSHLLVCLRPLIVPWISF